MGRYRVVGRHEVAGHPPGATFTHTFSPGCEAALVEGGHIVPVKQRTAKKPADNRQQQKEE